MAEAGVSIVTFDLKKKKYPPDTVQRGTGNLVTMSCSAANKVRISGSGSGSGPFGQKRSKLGQSFAKKVWIFSKCLLGMLT